MPAGNNVPSPSTRSAGMISRSAPFSSTNIHAIILSLSFFLIGASSLPIDTKRTELAGSKLTPEVAGLIKAFTSGNDQTVLRNLRPTEDCPDCQSSGTTVPTVCWDTTTDQSCSGAENDHPDRHEPASLESLGKALSMIIENSLDLFFRGGTGTEEGVFPDRLPKLTITDKEDLDPQSSPQDVQSMPGGTTQAKENPVPRDPLPTAVAILLASVMAGLSVISLLAIARLTKTVGVAWWQRFAPSLRIPNRPNREGQLDHADTREKAVIVYGESTTDDLSEKELPDDIATPLSTADHSITIDLPVQEKIERFDDKPDTSPNPSPSLAIPVTGAERPSSPRPRWAPVPSARPAAHTVSPVLDLALLLPGAGWMVHFLVAFLGYFGILAGPSRRH